MVPALSAVPIPLSVTTGVAKDNAKDEVFRGTGPREPTSATHFARAGSHSSRSRGSMEFLMTRVARSVRPSL